MIKVITLVISRLHHNFLSSPSSSSSFFFYFFLFCFSSPHLLLLFFLSFFFFFFFIIMTTYSLYFSSSSVSGFIMLALIYGKWFSYILARKLFSFVQGLGWALNGTYIDLWRSKREGNYHRSAQLLDIVYRYKLDLVLEPSGPGNFITTHNGFVSPSYVLQDNVTLYYITATEAVFIESPEEIDVSHSDYGSFIRVAQFENARRVIKIPIAAFHKMAEEIGDPEGKVIFVTNTARCGSTLINQMFEETECCIGFSEPDAFNAIATYKDKVPQEQLDQIITSCVRMQCKPFRKRKIEAYIIKPTAPTIDAVPMFERLYPDGKQLFMYRGGLKVAQSIVRTSTQMPMLALTFILTKIHPRLSEMSVEAMGLPAKEFAIKLPSPMTFSVFIWAMICKKYLVLRKQGVSIHAVKYEDLVKHPVESASAIMEYCGLPKELAEKAVRALSKDSQRHSPLSMKNMAKAKTYELEGNDKVVADAICDKMGIPRIPQNCELEGTITTVKSTQQQNGTTQ